MSDDRFRPLSWCSTSLLPDEASVPASCSSLLCSCFNTSCITRRATTRDLLTGNLQSVNRRFRTETRTIKQTILRFLLLFSEGYRCKCPLALFLNLTTISDPTSQRAAWPTSNTPNCSVRKINTDTEENNPIKQLFLHVLTSFVLQTDVEDKLQTHLLQVKPSSCC